MYVRELTKRRYRGKKPVVIRGPADVVRLFPKLPNEQREHFIVVLLNARHEVDAVETVSIGSLNASIVHPREVFRIALIGAAYAIVLMHNHPSGEVTPSNADCALTKRIKEAGEILRVEVHDHVIVGHQRYFSFRESGLM